MPAADRTYFHLVYGTRHVKGLVEFRKVEEKFVEQQEQIRLTAKQDRRVERTGQGEMFAAAMTATGGPPSFQDERTNNQRAARDRLDSLVRGRRQVPYYPDASPCLFSLFIRRSGRRTPSVPMVESADPPECGDPCMPVGPLHDRSSLW
jgi:hypothetical protein